MGDLASLGDLRGKRVLVRSDLNVPLDGTTITDDGRIRASIPTIKALTEGGARVIVCAHLGRPKGAPEDKYSLAPVAARLGELLGQDVTFATDTVGESVLEICCGDALATRARLYRSAAEAGTPQMNRYSNTEIRSISTVDVAALRQRADETAVAYRELDTLIQAANWTVDLIE